MSTDPTKIDVDPALFGAFPDDEIEVIDDVPGTLGSPEQRHRWNREAMLVATYGFCVECDGPVNSETYRMHETRAGTATRYECCDCGATWMRADEKRKR